MLESKIPSILEIDRTTTDGEFTTALESNALPYRIVARWTKRYCEEREGDSIEHKSGHVASEFTDENIKLIRRLIKNDLR